MVSSMAGSVKTYKLDMDFASLFSSASGSEAKVSGTERHGPSTYSSMRIIFDNVYLRRLL